MPRDPWDGNVETAYESKYESLSEPGDDGNRTYDSGTYGQNDYTVRERSDGTYDVYTTSDSDRGHAHDRLDSEGNLIDSYHDYIMLKEYLINLKQLNSKTEDEVLEEVTEILRSSKVMTLSKKKM